MLHDRTYIRQKYPLCTHYSHCCFRTAVSARIAASAQAAVYTNQLGNQRMKTLSIQSHAYNEIWLKYYGSVLGPL